jgi:hypothetical protein
VNARHDGGATGFAIDPAAPRARWIVPRHRRVGAVLSVIPSAARDLREAMGSPVAIGRAYREREGDDVGEVFHGIEPARTRARA